MLDPPRPGNEGNRDASVLARVAALRTKSIADLKTEWRALFGGDAPNNSRPFLELRLAYRIQELSYGGPGRPAVRLLDALADELHGKPGRKAMMRESRTPVAGTRLLREWDGVEHTRRSAPGSIATMSRRTRSVAGRPLQSVRCACLPTRRRQPY